MLESPLPIPRIVVRILALLVAASAFAAASTDSAVASTTSIALGETTVIEGSEAGMARVTVPRDAQLNVFGDVSFNEAVWSTSGGGRFIGFVLRPAGDE